MVKKKIESKKKADTTVASKTARASMAKKTVKEGFIASGDMDRIVPLCGGEFCYILDPRDGLTNHVRVGSDKYNNLISDLMTDPKHGAKIDAQIQKLGWSGRFQ